MVYETWTDGSTTCNKETRKLSYAYIKRKPLQLQGGKKNMHTKTSLWGKQQSITLAQYFPLSHLLGLTFLSEGNLPSDGVNEEHLTRGNPGCLFHEAEPQVSVESVAVITIQRFHLHEWDP